MRGPLPSTLACAVPFWVVASGLFGCLADPPTFAPRGQIPPFIIAGQVEPPLGSIYEGSEDLEINVPFRSEDVNMDLTAVLYLDLVPGAAVATVVGFAPVPPGIYEEDRLVSMRPRLPVVGGCQSLTLILTYDENLDRLRSFLPIDEARAARAIWWLNIGDGSDETRLADCPRPSQVDAVPGGG